MPLTSADYRRIRGPNLVKPAVEALLKDRTWVPEFLLDQVAGTKVHYLRASSAYKTHRKSLHKARLRPLHRDWSAERLDREAEVLAAADYNRDPERADAAGRHRVVVNVTLRGSPRYEAQVGPGGQWQWRLAPGAPPYKERPARPKPAPKAPKAKRATKAKRPVALRTLVAAIKAGAYDPPSALEAIYNAVLARARALNPDPLGALMAAAREAAG
jgi:hypothetical protein